MTGSSAGPDTCAWVRGVRGVEAAEWEATHAASSSSFATLKWAGQPHRPCMRSTRWTFARDGGIRKELFSGEKSVKRRDLALSHRAKTRGQCPSPRQSRFHRSPLVTN